MVPDMACSVSVGLATGLAFGVSLSWDGDDRVWLADRVGSLVRGLGCLVDGIAARVGRIGVAGGQSVSLGEVSEMIDVVILGLSAGLSFDSSLELYCRSRSSHLARSLARALLSWRIGAGTREMELAGVARGLGLKVLESFAVSVSEALALGAPLAETLASQEREIRATRRAEVERAIERAPVKLLIPTGTLILPALLLSILGPFAAASGMW